MSEINLSNSFIDMVLNPSGRPVLQDGEVELRSEADITIVLGADHSKLAPLVEPCVMLTNYRLIVSSIKDGKSHGQGCELCNMVSICDCSGFFLRSRRIAILFANGHEISLRFMKSGKELFLIDFQRALAKKSWESIPKIATLPGSSSGSRMPETSKQKAMNAGIGGILRKQEKERRAVDGVTKEALGDMDALMQRAREAVSIVERYAAFSASAEAQAAADDTSTTTGEDEVNEMESMFQSIGIISPVTKYSAGRQFHQELARQIVDVLSAKNRLGKLGGMITLSDLYCLYNRARGTELVSPGDLLAAVECMGDLHIGMKLRKFPSGVLVIEASDFNEAEIHQKIMNIIRSGGTSSKVPEQPVTFSPVTPGVLISTIAHLLKISILVAQEHVLSAEKKGSICRDDSFHGLLFYPNYFDQFGSA